jgi:uridylate kinase
MNIEATRLNAHLVKNLFGSAAYEKIILDPTLSIKTDKKIVVGGGWKPGWSTDFVAVKVAEKQSSPIVINLSNIDYAYTADPKKYPDAKKLEKVAWKNFRKIVGNVWKPGLNAPFDPIASRLGEKLKLTVIIANGKNLKNLKNILEGKKYTGTTINNDKC